MNHFKAWIARGIGKKNFLFLDDGEMNFYGSWLDIEGFAKRFKGGESLVLRSRVEGGAV